MHDNLSVPVLPNLCRPTSILSLIIIGELFALMLVLANGQPRLSWQQVGQVSLITQWIILCCALFLCYGRRWLNKCDAVMSGVLSYTTCLLISALVLGGAQLVSVDPFNWEQWLKGFLIAAIFSGILLRYLYIQQQLINQQQAEVQARFQALQSRIRPHFLFNSMNTIASLISIDPDAAEKAVENLSSLFRSSLQSPGLVKFEDEIELCRRYMAIEHQRLGDRLAMHWNIDKTLNHMMVPSLFLQPLLENAIVHGIQRMPSGGEIRLTTLKENQQVIFTVSNSIPQKNTSAPQVDTGNQIALDNIKNRLRLHYGENIIISIREDNQCYTVSIVIPITGY